MRWIYPTDGLGLFDRRDVEANDDGFVVASNQHAFKEVGVAGVDFLVGNIGGHPP